MGFPMDEAGEASFTAAFDANVLAIAGEIDELSGPALRDALQAHSDQFSHDLLVDLTEVTFLPSLGVGVLAVAMKSAKDAGHEITLRASEGSVAQRVLTICNLPFESV